MKFIKRLIIFILFIAVAAGAAEIAIGYSKYTKALEEKPLDVVISELKSEVNYTTAENVPQIYFQAVVAVEDRRFYMHNGFDIIGTVRAIYTDLKAKEMLEGGSTITQQLAKNLYFPQDNSLARKIAEVFMAVHIEKEYSKQDILEFYVNAIYYGSGYYNIHDASVGYFKKTPINMTDYECTLLAGIPNAPSVYSLDVNPDLAKKRQKKVVSCMVECGYISDETSILN